MPKSNSAFVEAFSVQTTQIQLKQLSDDDGMESHPIYQVQLKKLSDDDGVERHRR